MSKKVKYLLIWILPLLLLIGCGIQFVRSAFIFMFISDQMERLDGFCLLLEAIFYFIGFLVCVSISMAVTVVVYRKDKNM